MVVRRTTCRRPSSSVTSTGSPLAKPASARRRCTRWRRSGRRTTTWSTTGRRASSSSSPAHGRSRHVILPPSADLEGELAAARRAGDLDRYLGLLAGEELFVPIRRPDAEKIVEERAETFPNVYFESGGDEFLQVFTRGAMPNLGQDVVFMSGSLDWAVDGVGRHERVVFNRGTRG